MKNHHHKKGFTLGVANESCGRGGWWNSLDAYTSKPSYECLLRIGDAVTT
ncbi:MAG: hypothetical protein AAB770_02480 [Patescibacteria group bacterium]